MDILGLFVLFLLIGLAPLPSWAPVGRTTSNWTPGRCLRSIDIGQPS